MYRASVTCPSVAPLPTNIILSTARPRMPNREEIHALGTLVERFEATAENMDRSAVNDRRSLQQSINDLQFQFRSLDEKIDQMSSIVAQQAAIIRSFEDERQRQTGAKGAVKLIWGILATGIAGAAYALHDITQFFFAPRH